MVRAVILKKKNHKWMETLTGTARDGIFTYKWGEAAIGIGGWTWFKIGGKTDKIPFDEDMMVDLGEGIGNIAVYEHDGKNFSQINFEPATHKSNIGDWAKDWELGKFAEEAVLKRPEDQFASATKWLVFISIMVALIATIWNTNHAANTISHASAPFTNISVQNQQILYQQANVITALIRRENITDAYMRNITLYLQNQNKPGG